MADPVNPPSTTALPTGAGPATPITVPTTGQSTNATTPGLDILLGSCKPRPEATSNMAPGRPTARRSRTVPQSPTPAIRRPCRIPSGSTSSVFVRGRTKLPSPTTPPPDHTSCCHAIFFLLLARRKSFCGTSSSSRLKSSWRLPPLPRIPTVTATRFRRTPAALPAGGGGNVGGLDRRKLKTSRSRRPGEQRLARRRVVAVSTGGAGQPDDRDLLRSPAPPAPGPLLQACVASMRSAGTQPDGPDIHSNDWVPAHRLFWLSSPASSNRSTPSTGAA